MIPDTRFFQSSEFAAFQRKIPYRGSAWEFSCGPVRAVVIKQKIRLGYCWFWVPYGPVVDTSVGASPVEVERSSVQLFGEISRLGKKEKAVFARFEPSADFSHAGLSGRVSPLHTLGSFSTLGDFSLTTAKKRFTPEHTLLLDLTKSEDELLAQMKPKGRYNINVAKRHGLVVRQSEDPGDVEIFYNLLAKTASRDTFGVHSKLFYEELIKTLAPKNIARMFLAHLPGKPEKVVAGSIVIFYQQTAIYYYGASDYEHRPLMAPYLVQWEAIREAKKRGCRQYDFLGVAPDDDVDKGPRTGAENPLSPEALEQSALKKKPHPWAGVTDFKEKFGGERYAFPKAFDLVFKKWSYRIVSRY